MNRMIEAYDKLDAMLRKERDDYEMQACELSHKLATVKGKLIAVADELGSSKVVTPARQIEMAWEIRRLLDEL